MDQINISDKLIILAMLIAPILAVQIQEFIDRKREKRSGRMRIFETLMATRATPLSPYHVEALNKIDIEFYDNKKIKEAWKAPLDNFVNYPKDPKVDDYQVRLTSCSEKSSDLLTDLLYEMAKSLNYDFDKVHLKRGVYIPKGHADLELENEVMRRAFLEILIGKKSLPINVVELSKTTGKESFK